jgi:predicted nucleic acid-binding protein
MDKGVLKIYFDTNVLFDIVAKREPYFEPSLLSLKHCVENACETYISDSIITTLIYLIERNNIEKGHEKLKQLMLTIDFVCLSKLLVNNAIDSDFGDKEDAVQYFATREKNCDYFITRNAADFVENAVPHLLVITPEDFNKLFEPEKKAIKKKK